jgi:hypothetical protein
VAESRLCDLDGGTRRLDRDPRTTLFDGRYLGLATNPFSRGDAEREWALIGQAALWSNLTDEP